jgi:hypothetical protein
MNCGLHERPQPAIRRPRRGMLSIGLYDNCNALVVSAEIECGKLAAAEPAVREFPNSKIFAN